MSVVEVAVWVGSVVGMNVGSTVVDREEIGEDVGSFDEAGVSVGSDVGLMVCDELGEGEGTIV